ncbi:MAG: hypothetical protein CTY40_01135 [Hyphomicrobium sp.]|nr:MAG: hypothetical protein CTY40_01135 [Hyphomicrobium sp.]
MRAILWCDRRNQESAQVQRMKWQGDENMMKLVRSTVQGAAVAGIALAALAAPAFAGSLKDEAPAEEGRKLTWSFNIAGTSDYVFRGHLADRQ